MRGEGESGVSGSTVSGMRGRWSEAMRGKVELKRGFGDRINNYLYSMKQ